ncbi:outer membrane lipoprotein-sorting protein [Dysgonomonas sp. PFB1-18]|uniref:outer membrane lipoprotein-sorting protein n=1 Tax=unclassified Dysgonomonas TaxID=2630389 RepID=UPI0024755457|nr:MULTISPECIES: outer membrane lipoprotein-sorting protein [unclassified Dysgonomonas]MDH6309369.1 outer membrane lipoprotein-sorting protein [Dysgonomonas sp. PF1-14]MDH6339766.1 outer membrane lipoprotein-sorting protein [Dysgonomonas sp. PF1-16]MDH6381414.1 outer membrane lipoprotein-sorting protein [Dysgonomonas sp. PFB1-18]MDH6398629.1 outer membrane lipoprotein-sorting protein [Dysgonomonas sp. PF1-23]
MNTKFLILLTAFLCLLTNQTKANMLTTDYLSDLDESIYMEYASMKMEMIKDNRVIRYYDMEFYRSANKMRMEFTAPASEKGRRMLNDNSSLWMYLPRTSKVIKLPFKQSFMGSDASNADLMRLCFKNDYEVVNSIDKENDIVQLELKAKNLEVAYNKVILQYDTKRKVPISQEMYSLSNKLIKTMIYENIIKIDGAYIPSTILIKEELQKNTETKLYYTNIKKRNAKPTEYFTLGSLRR